MSERWERATSLFGAARALDPSTRHSFLRIACEGDDSLRTEVEALLASDTPDDGFLENAPWAGLGKALVEPMLAAGQVLKGRYRVEEELATGGQARVYQASDELLSRPVVIKLMRAEGRRNGLLKSRFEQEMKALAHIDHPGVVGILNVGELEDGAPFLVIQHIPGISLREALIQGPMTGPRVAGILRQMGAALRAAHLAGIAHQDLKPENVMLQPREGGAETVRLIDFGIAKIDTSSNEPGTTTVMVAGTVRYMAPEQFEGKNSTACDIYSMGLVACEMLCGHPDVRALPKQIERGTRAALDSALAFRPEDRPADVQAWCERLAETLRAGRKQQFRRIVAGIVLSAILVFGAAAATRWYLNNSGEAVRIVEKTGEIQTLAILPFQMLGPSAEIEALEVGVADTLITRLSNISGLIVRPISTVRRYNVSTIDPVRAARELQVDAIVEGTLQSSETRIRANVRLIRAEDGRALWAGTVESEGGRLFTLEDSIAQQIASNVNSRLTDSERRNLETRRRLDPEAHELYVKGRFEWGKRSHDGFEKGAEYFRRAIDLDPTYARAHIGLADCFLLLGGYSHHPQLEMLRKAKALALRALELDPSLGEAHATLGLISQNLDWDWNNVERHYRQAIALAPNYATGHHWYAEFLSILGRFEESRRGFAQARRIDPISPIIQVDEAQLYFFERQYGRSLDILDRVAQMDPNFELVHERIALIYMAQGREEEAWQKIQRLTDCREEGSDCRRFWTACLPARDPAAGREALLWIEDESKRRRIPPSVLVYAHSRQGNYGRALDWLEGMLEKHEVWLITSKVNPLFDPLRTQPRFERVLQKLNLAD